MAKVITLTFNPFQENTFLVVDDHGECVIFDPGCLSVEEQKTLTALIEKERLTPVRLINTHCHIDHVFGNTFVAEKYNLALEIHEDALPMLKASPRQGAMFGLKDVAPSPEPERFIEDGEVITFGRTELKAIHTPGHSAGSLSFYCEEDKFVIVGDVLFDGSIGRTDLPGGDYDTLISSIMKRLLPIGDDVIVYSGHGPSTTIGRERRMNPFLTGMIQL